MAWFSISTRNFCIAFIICLMLILSTTTTSFASDVTSPQILSINPLPIDGGTTDVVIDSLIINTSEELNAVSVNAANAWSLREAGGDGIFDTADDVIFSFAVPSYTSGSTINLRITDGPLPNGHYRFTAKGTITDRSGNPLDGNGDGVGGDSYQQTFDVAFEPWVTFEGRSNNTIVAATSLSLN